VRNKNRTRTCRAIATHCRPLRRRLNENFAVRPASCERVGAFRLHKLSWVASMNVATAFVWLMFVGVLAIAAVPQRQDAIQHQADDASAVPAKQEMKWQRQETGQRKPPEVDPMVVSTLPDRSDAPVRAEALSSPPSRVVPVAQRSRASAVKRDHSRQARDIASARKSTRVGRARAEPRPRVSSQAMVTTIDQRP
jgi:hypothetical protein